MKETLEYIKCGDTYYYPSNPDGKWHKDNCVYSRSPNIYGCIIKKLLFGRYEIQYFNAYLDYQKRGGWLSGVENIPNTKVIIYPSAISEIKYIDNKPVKN